MLFLEKIKQVIFNKKIKSSKQIETEISLKTIVEIPLRRIENTSELLVYENEKSVDLKAFKQLVTNVQFLCVNNSSDKKVILITSPERYSGKSYVTANIAVAFSKIGKKVLVIDADMVNGRQDKIFNVPNNLGLSNYLSNLDSNGVEINEFLSKFINETEIKNINLITAGTIPPNPAELLSSKKLPELIKDVKVFFDVILIDSSEVLNKTEALVLTRNSNSTILVANSGMTGVEELEKTKKDIQNVGGKILGVVLNKVKLPKVKKTKAQKKEEFAKFRLKVKEKINITIELIKRKFSSINQKLLEEAKDVKNIKNTTNAENQSVNEKVNLNTEIDNKKDIEKNVADNNAITENNLNSSFNNTSNFIINLKEKILKENDKQQKVEEKSKKIENAEKQIIQEAKEVIDMLETQIIADEKLNSESIIKEKVNENIEEKISVFSKIKNASIDKIQVVKNKIRQNRKNKIASEDKESKEDKETKEENEKNKKEFINAEKIKEKITNLYGVCKNFCLEKYNNLKDIKINKKAKNENNIEDENKKIVVETEEVKNKCVSEKSETIDDSIKNEKMLLVIVDAENGCCRTLSQEYFSEKPIRGLDKDTGHVKAHYSIKSLNRKRQYFMERYQITEIQAKRIDILIYDTLKDYDEYQWIERKIPSDKAENYALLISRDFEREPEEAEKQYNVRCQRLRKSELEKIGLNIEYKLDNLWKTTKISVLDKIQLNKFAKHYEIENAMRNDSEIMKSKKTKKFYTDIITGAEERLEKANEEDKKKEESEKQVIEEDRKIKQEELKFEQQQFELEKKAAQERIKLEQENIRAEKKAEQERIKEEKRKEREIEKIEKKEENIRRKKERQKQKEEVKFQKERERLKQMEEAKIEEELLVDNLYPKTKNNKNL